jgi:hypothetical protein
MTDCAALDSPAQNIFLKSHQQHPPNFDVAFVEAKNPL